MSHFIYLVSTVFWTYRNVLRLNVLLTGSGNGLMPIWQQDISSQWTLVFFFFFFTWVPQEYSGLMFIDSMASYHLNTQHYQMAKKTPRPRITKTTTNQNACWHWDHDRHITWHSAWHPPKNVHVHIHIHTYIHIYIYTHTHAYVYLHAQMHIYTHPQ